MATSPVQIDPNTGERVQTQTPQIDPLTGERVQTKPADPLTPTQLPADAGDDVWKAGVHAKMLDVTPGYAYQNREEIEKQFRARGGDYDSTELDPTIENDIKVGLQRSIFGLMKRNQLPDEVKDGGMVDKFITGVAEMIPDIPFYLAGGAAGGAATAETGPGAAVGAGAGAFALPAAMREALVVGIKNGKVQSFGDLMKRSADVVWAGTKGAAVGVATELAGGLPVGPLAKVPLASTVAKGLYQSAAMVTAGDLLDGKVPNAKDFASNAALIIPLNLITHGIPLKGEQAHDAVMDVYTKDGTTPQATTDKLGAQPPVKPDPAPGLRPAIKIGETVVDANENETHAELSERVLAKKPVTMEALEADPALADDVLQNPHVQEQPVLDRAWMLKKEAIERGEVQGEVSDGTLGTATRPPEASSSPGDASQPSESRSPHTDEQGASPDSDTRSRTSDSSSSSAGQGSEGESGVTPASQQRGTDDSTAPSSVEDSGRASKSAYDSVPLKQVPRRTITSIEELYNRGDMKSGRGFLTPDAQFISREQARKWSKQNEPDVHEMWSKIAGGDREEFHSEEYQQARERVQTRTLAEGEPSYDGLGPDLTKFYAGERADLNKIKAGDASKGYGNAVIRTLWVGPRNALRAEGEQIVSKLRKIVPDGVDQEAISFMRDYRDDPDKLRAQIEEIRNGTNEKLKPFIPSMERALNPSPEMQQADQQLTNYFKMALARGQQLDILHSDIDPSRYSPRMFMRAEEDAETGRGVGTAKFTQNTPNAIQRKYLNVLDPLKSEDGSVEARTFNAFDETSIYADRHAVAVATKLFITELKNSEMGKWGTQANHPDGWVELDPGRRSLQKNKAIIDKETGEPEIVSRSLYVPAKIADAMKPLLKTGGDISEFAELLHVQSFTKALELSLSAFHIKALSITAMNNLKLSEYYGALHSDNASPEFETIEKRGALYGLTTSKTGPAYEAYRGLEKSSVPTGLDKLADVPVIKQVDALAKKITQETFDVVQRKFKVMDYAAKESSWLAKHPKGTESEYAEAMRGISKQVNSAYGGLNWEVMGKSKGFQSVARMLLLAPDWTFSNVASLKYAGEGGTVGSAARHFWVKSFATGFAMSYAMSQFTSGKHDWDKPEMVHLGTDDQGKEMYANMFFAGAPKDAITLTHRVMKDGPAGIAEFMASKVGPVLGTVYGLASNKDYAGRQIFKSGDDLGTKALKQGEFAGEKLAPITGVNTAETAWKAMTDPNHNYSYKDILELMGDAAGVSVVHEGSGGGTPLKGAGGAKKGAGMAGEGKRKFSIAGGKR